MLLHSMLAASTFSLKMATKQFGEAHVLSLNMHFVKAITSELSDSTTRREESEAHIMGHRFKDIAKPGDSTSLIAGAVFERLNTEYEKRGWYSLSKRLYEITFPKLSLALGWCHEDAMRSLWFMLKMYWRVDGKAKLYQTLKEIDTWYQQTEPKWRETVIVSMRLGGQFLLRKNLPVPASLDLRQVLEWVETFPTELDAEWVAETWRYLAKALDGVGDEMGARDSEIQAEKFDAKARDNDLTTRSHKIP